MEKQLQRAWQFPLCLQQQQLKQLKQKTVFTLFFLLKRKISFALFIVHTRI